jgi:chemotaxis protein methyltransferase WspC
MMEMERIEELLCRTMGLHADSIGSSTIERAVRGRLRALGLETIEDYWAQLQRSLDEVQELIEAVVVPETWFFRDPQAFSAMTRVLLQQAAARPTAEFRLLSLPCSTGEEPYTMAMALIDAGVPAERFRIDAIDISARSLAGARRGVYGANSFRGQDFAFRDRHFEPAERGYRIGEALRGQVRFTRANLFDADFPATAESYDIVFCRNLLIYFDVDTQGRAIGLLKRLLAPEGMLFVGPSEAGLMAANGFASARIPMAFAFRKSEAVAAPVNPETPVIKRPAPAASSAPHRPKPPRPFARIEPKPSSAPPRLDELRRIADRGQLAEAAHGCEAHMRRCGPSPDALLLLGLISDASGDPSAAGAYYRKALYLDPDHAEALGHLALLLKKEGNAAGAKRMNDRMARADGRRAR